ncbi:AGAP006713-PB-like protein [Anopheles sinensis]|uniref:Gustatory receptor n=1 Tax=Anopheles sinensis TaxID=74873 RepID=A0A084WLL6_ANOSI|nr:AGAP006713-PB-like protein [Anopheles sinensis]
MDEPNSQRDRARSQLYQSLKPYLFYSQLMCSAPYPVECLQGSNGIGINTRSYFKSARFLLTAVVLSNTIMCSLEAMVELIDVPMPFFTGVLYVNEVVLGMVISLMTAGRGYKEGKHYDRFVTGILMVAEALLPSEWKNIVSSVQFRMRFTCTGLTIVVMLCLICDYVHFGSLKATLFSLGAYMMPNLLVMLSFLQCCFGTVLIYKLLQNMRHRLSPKELARCDLMERVVETERHYIQLTACMELIVRSFEYLIVINTFAGINVTSLQLLEIYQHLQQTDTAEVYIMYNSFWIVMQLCILLTVLYPCHLVKRELSRLGLTMFQLSQRGDARLEAKLARFGILTLNRKDVPYTALGMLKLELSSLSSIFVALLSFLIILIQFDSSNLNKHKGTVTTMDSLYNKIQD